MKKIFLFVLLPLSLYAKQMVCTPPSIIDKNILFQKALVTHDIRRNLKNLKNLCTYTISFKEHKYHWKMLLVYNSLQSKGPFWLLPHDDENTAFDAAVYAVNKYGGGFLAIIANDKRYYKKQDPNRNFSLSHTKEKSCKHQKASSYRFTKIITSIIQAYKDDKYPILALHNNKNSWYGGIGQGGVSILNASKSVRSYKAYKNITSYSKGLQDEDSLVYIAGRSKMPNKVILNDLLKRGLNVKYEIVNKYNNDCSLSNYVVLNKPHIGYYNIETEHGDIKTQKIMIDKLMQHIYGLQ